MSEQTIEFKFNYLPIADVRRGLQKLHPRYRDVPIDLLLDDPHDGSFDVYEYVAPLLNGKCAHQQKYISRAWTSVVGRNMSFISTSNSTRENRPSNPGLTYKLQKDEIQESQSTEVHHRPAGVTSCSIVKKLHVQSVTRSGSSIEQLGSVSSDQDLMYELGPITFHLDGTVVGPQGGVEVECIHSNEGFLLLSLPLGSGSEHSGMQLFSAETVRNINYELTIESLPKLSESLARVELACKDLLVTNAGPACNISNGDVLDIDHVPSIHLPFWPCQEFLRRQRCAGWPPPSLIQDIVNYGVHLVPTGLKGSAMRRHEWRISFTRAETLLSWSLPHTVRLAVRDIKGMKKLLPDKQTSVLKSYLLKTAAFWMVEDGYLTEKTRVRTCIHGLLKFLFTALQSGFLPCFCLRDMNIAHQFTSQELVSARDGITTLVSSSRQLMLSGRHQAAVIWLLEHPNNHIPLRELQEYATRHWLRHALELPRTVEYDGRLIEARLVLRKFAANLGLAGRRSCGDNVVTSCLLQAFVSCPRKLAKQMKISRKEDGSFTWLISPVFVLLQESDINELMFSDSGYHDLDVFLIQQRNLINYERQPGLTDDLCKPIKDFSSLDMGRLFLNRKLFFNICCTLSDNFQFRAAVLLDNTQIVDETMVEGKTGDTWRLTRWLPVLLPPPLEYPPPSGALID